VKNLYIFEIKTNVDTWKVVFEMAIMAAVVCCAEVVLAVSNILVSFIPLNIKKHI
jgi:hypothetical protein